MTAKGANGTTAEEQRRQIMETMAALPEITAAWRREGAAWVDAYFPELPPSVDRGAVWEALHRGAVNAVKSWQPGKDDEERCKALKAVGRAIARLRRVPGPRITAQLEAAFKIAQAHHATIARWAGPAPHHPRIGRPPGSGRRVARALLLESHLTGEMADRLLDACGLKGPTPRRRT